MNTSRKSALLPSLVLPVITALALLVGCGDRPAAAPTAPATVNIGWQTAWATQGQIALALQRTNALELQGLTGNFKSFLYGAPLTEAAVAGEVDFAFVGDQPAVNLLSKSPNWTIVARLMDFRVALLVPAKSDIRRVADLRGKTIAIPFGASTHRTTLQMLRDAGLDPAKDVSLRNMDIQEQSEVIKAGSGTSWGKIGAFASWDPHIAIAEKAGTARVVSSGTAIGLVLASNRALPETDQRVPRFLAAYKLAWHFYARNRALVDGWFSAANQGGIPSDLLARVAEVEGNTTAKDLKSVRVALSDTDIQSLQDAADFAVSEKLIKTPLDVARRVDRAPAARADDILAADSSSSSELRARE